MCILRNSNILESIFIHVYYALTALTPQQLCACPNPEPRNNYVPVLTQNPATTMCLS